jgi:hypothetical protein
LGSYKFLFSSATLFFKKRYSDYQKCKKSEISHFSMTSEIFLYQHFELDASPSSQSWLGCIYYTVDDSPNPGSLPPNVFVVVNDMAFVNTLSRQLDFGCFDDKVRRKSVYGITLLMMIVFSVVSGLSFSHLSTGVMDTLYFFGFWAFGSATASAATNRSAPPSCPSMETRRPTIPSSPLCWRCRHHCQWRGRDQHHYDLQELVPEDQERPGGRWMTAPQ